MPMQKRKVLEMLRSPLPQVPHIDCAFGVTKRYPGY